MTTSGVQPVSSTVRALRAFEYRDFRLYLFGLVASFAGTYMQQVAEGWLVYRLTNSAFALGFVGFAVMLPLAPLTLLAGVVADRLPRRRLLLWTQIGQVFPPMVLAALTWTGNVQVWHVIVIDLLMSTLSSIDQPVRQALLANTVESPALGNAIAMSGVGFNVARVFGPALAGILVAISGEAICFAFNGISFLLIAAALVAMRTPDSRVSAGKTSLKASAVDSVRYLTRERIIAMVVSLIVVINFFVVPYQTLLPVFARDILSAGPTGLGFLLAAAGGGAIVGSFGITGINAGRRGVGLILAGVAASAALAGFTLAHSLAVACLALFLVSGCIVALKVLAYTIVQGRAPDDMRGRIMSVVTLSDAGAPRVGALFAGVSANFWGAPVALQLSALGCLACTIILSQIMPSLRHLP